MSRGAKWEAPAEAQSGEVNATVLWMKAFLFLFDCMQKYRLMTEQKDKGQRVYSLTKDHGRTRRLQCMLDTVRSSA